MTEEKDDDGTVYKIVGEDDSDSDPDFDNLENDFLMTIGCLDGNTFLLDKIGQICLKRLHSLLDSCEQYEMNGYGCPIRFEIKSVLNRYYASKVKDYPSPDKVWRKLRDDAPSGIILTMASIEKAIVRLGDQKGYCGNGGFNDRLLYLNRKGFVNKKDLEDILLLKDIDKLARTNLSFDCPGTYKLMEWKSIYCNLAAQIFKDG